MSRRIIEGRWSCRSCDTQDILGRHKVCPACGSPRETSEMSFDLGEKQADGSSNAESVSDAEALALAEAGSDWFCAACDSGNRGDATTCFQCGSPREEAKKPPPPPPPEPEIPVKAGLGLGAIALGGFGVFSALCCCGVGFWITAPVETDAQVSQRIYHRQVDVERLTAFDRTAWKDVLPPPASPPGSEVLAAGLGEINRCRTAVCYPRPPKGGRLLAITSRAWSRTHTVRKMNSRSGSGWRSQVPAISGSYPVAGSGGVEGVEGAPSCHRKEKVPERCRPVSRREQCGTERKCSVRDMGNGFAEEVCEDVPKYCTVQDEECTPAQYADWCTWTELYWGPSRSESTEGTNNRPTWPSLAAGYREALTKTDSYRVETRTLAGTGKGPVSVTEKTLMSYGVGQQYFYDKVLKRVPDRLVRQGAGPFEDCGFDIPPNVLMDRDSCDYTSWEWVQESPRIASDDVRPPWPDGALGEDGRETRNEWAEVALTWSRGDKSYSETVVVTVEEADEWDLKRAVPVRVRYSGELDERLGAWPTATQKPVP